MSDVVVVNEGYEIRSTKGGTNRVVITVSAESLIHNLDPKTLGRGPAQAIAHHFRERIREISAAAAPATIKARQVAARALDAGREWAQRRYSGGRLGEMRPNESDRAFNDSGRLAEGIVANGSSDGVWRVNVPANRFQDSMTGGIDRIWRKLVSLVPEFANPELLLSQDLISASIQKAQRDMVTKTAAATHNLGIEVVLAALELVGQGLETLDEFAA
jgi:hypothetical protein